MIEQANRRAAQLIEEARTQAAAEGERIRQQAKEAVDQKSILLAKNYVNK